MPDYIMPIESAAARRRFADLDAFTQSYIEAALWCGLDEDEEIERHGEIGAVPFDDLADETVAAMVEDCTNFQESFGHLWGEGTAGDEQAGHDFWLTRNRHGAGFWDRPESFYLGKGDELSEAACAYGGVDLYFCDDGKIYQS